MGSAVLVFGATFLGLCAAGHWSVRAVPGLRFARQQAPVIRRPDASWYLASRGERALDDYVIWNGFGPTMAHAQAADILILGNSRMQFAFPSRVLRRFEARHGVSVFSMGLSFGEQYAFPLSVIRRFDLRPKLAIVNVDGFFRNGSSGMARQVIADGWWGGAKVLWEENVAARVRPVLTAVFPTFVARHPPHYFLRSSTHGAWLPRHWRRGHRAVVPGEPQDVETWLPTAREFQQEMARRGTTIVLTCVPSGPPLLWCTPELTEELASRLGAVAIIPDLPGLTTLDGSHLNLQSAKRFARAFLRRLERLDEFRRIGRPPE